MKRFLCTAILFVNSVGAQQTYPIAIDASASVPPPETGYLHLGGTSSDGHSLQVNSRYLVLDGKPLAARHGRVSLQPLFGVAVGR